MEKFYLPIEKQARIYLNQFPHEHIQKCWLGLHGYGMLGQYFLPKFEPLFQQDTLVIVPEALSRFYLDPQYEKVGASWMTKEDRLLDIQEQHLYLNKVYEQFVKPLKSLEQFNVLGFSQGVATAWRWIQQQKIQVVNLVIWAGSIPLEPVESFYVEKLWLVYAEDDPYAKWVNPQVVKDWLNSQSIDYELIVFKGGHTMPKEVFENLIAKIHQNEYQP
jgi:predicted esterase